MNKINWDTTYKKQGEIQTKISEFIIETTKIFKQNKAKTVLDLCFGTGRHTVYLAENGFTVYGIDISQAGKEITEKKIKEQKLGNVHLEVGDMNKLPYQNSFFDAILAVNCIEHNTHAEIKKVINKLYQILKPEGSLAATLISDKDPRNGLGRKIDNNTYINIEDPAEKDVLHHFSSENEVKKLFKKFKIIKLQEKIGFSERRNMRAVHWEIIAIK